MTPNKSTKPKPNGVTRYALIAYSDGTAEAYESPDGEYMLFSDYQKLADAISDAVQELELEQLTPERKAVIAKLRSALAQHGKDGKNE